MRELLLSLIGVSLLQCILQLSLKDELAGKIIGLIGSAAMTAMLIAGISGFDYRAYSAALTREREKITWDENEVRNNLNALHRRYIEEECAAYIIEEASLRQIELSDALVTLAWNTDGYWYPVHAEMTMVNCDENLSVMMRMIERELGIPVSEQVWRSEDESTESY